MFDPFGDFATAGYLQNVRKDKDPRDIKRFEHDLFEANIDTALAHLAAVEVIGYQDFLEVHRILFEDYYPWAGQDRSVTMPDRSVNKGGVVLFALPGSARLAVEEGLRLGRDQATMVSRPGEVMGFFAYGHPFLDGNGRTMLLVHMELCHRAGFSIAWGQTDKADYLAALTQEIDAPAAGLLDAYLLKFKAPRRARGTWGAEIQAMRGLDGLDDENEVDGDLADPAIVEKYRLHALQRGYAYAETKTLAEQWGAAPSKGPCVGKIVALSEREVIQDAGRGKFIAWERRNLNDTALAVGMNVTIHGSGRVEPQQRARDSLGQ